MTDREPWRSVWSPSRLRTAMTCSQKYLNEYGPRGWGAERPPGGPETRFGSALHAALAVWDRCRAPVEGGGFGFDKAVSLTVAVGYALSDTWQWGDWQTSRLNRRNLVRAVVWYADDQPSELREGLVAELIEAPLSVELGSRTPDGQSNRVEAVFDVIGRLAGMPVVVERKTTKGDIGPRFAARYSPDVQIDLEDAIAARYVGSVSEPHTLVVEAHQIAVGFSRWYRWIVGRSESQRRRALQTAVETIWGTTLAMRNAEMGHGVTPNTAVCGFYDHDRGEGGCPWRQRCAGGNGN